MRTMDRGRSSLKRVLDIVFAFTVVTLIACGGAEAPASNSSQSSSAGSSDGGGSTSSGSDGGGDSTTGGGEGGGYVDLSMCHPSELDPLFENPPVECGETCACPDLTDWCNELKEQYAGDGMSDPCPDLGKPDFNQCGIGWNNCGIDKPAGVTYKLPTVECTDNLRTGGKDSWYADGESGSVSGGFSPDFGQFGIYTSLFGPQSIPQMQGMVVLGKENGSATAYFMFGGNPDEIDRAWCDMPPGCTTLTCYFQPAGTDQPTEPWTVMQLN